MHPDWKKQQQQEKKNPRRLEKIKRDKLISIKDNPGNVNTNWISDNTKEVKEVLLLFFSCESDIVVLLKDTLFVYIYNDIEKTFMRLL